MVKVKWLARTASANGVIHPGEIMDWNETDAKRLEKAGYVEILDNPKKVAKKEEVKEEA